jgi:hypothetical protein
MTNFNQILLTHIHNFYMAVTILGKCISLVHPLYKIGGIQLKIKFAWKLC